MTDSYPSDTALSEIDFLTTKEKSALSDAKFLTIRDLLNHFPRRYEDRRRFDSFPVAPGNESICIHAQIIDTRTRFGGRMRFFEAIIQDLSPLALGPATITCRWFNMPYLSKILAAGQEIVLYGKPKEYQNRIYIDHPDFEVIQDDSHSASIHLERIVPIYRNISGISQRRLREILYLLVEKTTADSLTAPMDVDSAYPRAESFQDIHFPESMAHVEAARRRFALEEFFAIQLNVAYRRNQIRQANGRVQGKKMALLTQFYNSLPFDLTDAQKRSIHEIIDDMRKPHPMNRLLQGDVGSGKTFVALAAILLAVDSGAQAALMAPTQILAEQHYLTFQRYLEPLGLRIALHTADNPHETEQDTLFSKAEKPDIIIGTHALLYEHSLFSDLGLVVIDEQHKFGVLQRGKLISQGVRPDVLVMTATPIPRTLTMTIYGDLDVSVLDELPAGRGKLVTALRISPKQTDLTDFVKTQLAAGRQAYLVYPLVEDSEKLKAESATTGYEKWAKRLSSYEVGLLHGKLDGSEKDQVMRRFRDGEIDVLVATTVVEVGVDVPNANLMYIYNAERFGLAQLHQLRGRIGRGKHKSYCVLLSKGKPADSLEKLKILTKTNDGFKIAEEDLRLRGPGDVLGTLQSGLGTLRFPEFLADTELLRQARALADQILTEDPELAKEHSGLQVLLS